MILENGVYKKRWFSSFDNKTNRTTLLSIYDDLIRRYNENHRAYHNFKHITDCLKKLDIIGNRLEQPFSLELALWFHDAIYDPKSNKNEEDSAELAAKALSRLGVPSETLDRVCNLILVTKHPSIPKNSDEGYILDIDLSILGSPQDIFIEYESNIREEYNWVPMKIYQQERAKLLESFLSQDRIYKTDFFSERFEKLARKNIKSSIERLKLSS